MRTLAAILLAGSLLLASGAGAETCAEAQESCLESCKIDHGMEADRRLLTRCLTHCTRKREDCQDVQREERSSERLYETAPPDRRGDDGDDWANEEAPAPDERRGPAPEPDLDDTDWAAE